MKSEGTCWVPLCEEPVAVKKWQLCRSHYDYRCRTGHPVPVSRISPMERLWAKRETTDSGCWLWTGAKYPSGYGAFTWNGVQTGAHRAAYQMMVGPIPDGLVLDHTCHNTDPDCPGGDTCWHRACFNAAHLEPVTRQVNSLRGKGPPAIFAARTECARGHDLTDPANIRTNRHGVRNCKPCANLHERTAYHQGRRKKKPKGWAGDV